jgi:hypothetical protein
VGQLSGPGTFHASDMPCAWRVCALGTTGNVRTECRDAPIRAHRENTSLATALSPCRRVGLLECLMLVKLLADRETRHNFIKKVVAAS